jgi:hypothetical protein
MEKLIPRIREIARKIAETESRRRGVAELLRESSPGLGLFHRVEQSGLKGLKVVGVDGGMAKKSLHGMDCVLVRSVGACFTYQDNKIKEVSYYPSKVPPVQAEVTDLMSDIDWNFYTSIVRAGSEVRTAISCVERFGPTFCSWTAPSCRTMRTSPRGSLPHIRRTGAWCPITGGSMTRAPRRAPCSRG